MRKVRQDTRWPTAHLTLKKLYEDRIRDTLSQGEFGKEYGIGTQGMVWQYLNGYTPLNIEVACKFAEGLRCTIKDISPEMHRLMEQEVLPALGLKSWRRVAAIALTAIGLAPLMHAPDAQATTASAANGVVYYVKSVIRRLLGVFTGFVAIPTTG